MVSKTHDPLGFAAPFPLKAKRILQVLFNSNYSWDEAVSDDQIKDWNKWNAELQLLEGLGINRCFQPSKLVKGLNGAYTIFEMQAKMNMGKCHT